MKLFTTVSKAATVAEVSPRHMLNIVNRGEIQGVRVGRVWRIPVTELATYLHVTPEQITEALADA